MRMKKVTTVFAVVLLLGVIAGESSVYAFQKPRTDAELCSSASYAPAQINPSVKELTRISTHNTLSIIPAESTFQHRNTNRDSFRPHIARLLIQKPELLPLLSRAPPRI